MTLSAAHRAALVLIVALAWIAVAQAQDIKVALLGTGCPPPVMNRFGPSILVEAGGQKFLFDAGRGATQRLAQLKVRWQDVDVAEPDPPRAGRRPARA
jgi:ribonuclease Z